MRRRDPEPLWVAGKGRFAVISDCPPGRTIVHYENLADAEAALELMRFVRCGHECWRAHRLGAAEDLLPAVAA